MIADRPDCISSQHSIRSSLRAVMDNRYFIGYVYPFVLLVAAPFLVSIYRWLGLAV